MIELHLHNCPRALLADVEERLEHNGVLAVSLLDNTDSPILEPLPGETPLWDYVTVHAMFENTQQLLAARSLLHAHFPELEQTEMTVADKDWERVCLDEFKPQRYGQQLWVCPSWFSPPQPDAVNLILDPGLAFGTGSHPTTSLCLTWLAAHEMNNKIVIDYGCGSGILALAAIKLGAAHAHAVDIDPQALTATTANAQLNHITTQLTVAAPHSLHDPVDVVMANIVLNPLLALHSRFHALLKPQGDLIISGLYAKQADALIHAYAPWFKHQHTMAQDEWVLIAFKPH